MFLLLYRLLWDGGETWSAKRLARETENGGGITKPVVQAGLRRGATTGVREFAILMGGVW